MNLKETLAQQYQYLKFTMSRGSHPKQFGDARLLQDPVSLYMGTTSSMY